MDGKEKEMLTALQNKTNTNTNALVREVDIQQGNAKYLFTRWKKKLHEYEDTAFHYQLMSYHRILTSQMEFKDKLIEKLQNELNQFREHRRKTGQINLELVNNTLNAFTKEMEEIHDLYQVEVSGALPINLTELEVRINENDNYWRILKNYENVIQIQTQKKNSKIKNQHIGYKDVENGRFESIVDTFRRSDFNRCKNMAYNYNCILNEYTNNTKDLMIDYLKLKEKDEHLSILKIKLNTRIESLLNTISNLEKEIKESKSLKEINKLIKERQEVQDGLKKFIKKLENHSECGKKHLSLLCKSTKPINNEINNVLKKGNDILKCISLCQKLETPEEKAKLWSTCNKSNSILQSEHSVVLGILSNFLSHVTDVKLNSKLMDAEVNKLYHEYNELTNKIRCLVQKKKNIIIINK